MLAWIRGGEGEMTAERRATHTHAGAVGAVFVYSIRTRASLIAYCYGRGQFNAVQSIFSVFGFAQAICYVHSIIINFIPGILEAKKMIQKYNYPHV